MNRLTTLLCLFQFSKIEMWTFISYFKCNCCQIIISQSLVLLISLKWNILMYVKMIFYEFCIIFFIYLKFTHLWQNQFVDHLFTMTFVDVVHFLFSEWENDNNFYSDNVIDFWIEDFYECKHAIKYFLFFPVQFFQNKWTLLSFGMWKTIAFYIYQSK